MENIAEIQFKGLEGFVKDFKAEDQGKAQKEFLVKRIQDFPKFLDIKNRKTYEVLTFIMSNMFQIVSNMADVVYITKLMGEIIPWDVNLIKLTSFCVCLIVTISVIEPEKMKYFNIVAICVFCGIGNINILKTFLSYKLKL